MQQWPVATCVLLHVSSPCVMENKQILMLRMEMFFTRKPIASLTKGNFLSTVWYLDFSKHWQSLPATGKMKQEKNDNMVPLCADSTEPSVLTLLLKHTQLFMRAKLNQTVGVVGKNICFWSLFCLESHQERRKQAITPTQISLPKS